MSSLGERIKGFKATYARPGDDACLTTQGTLVQLIYDLIDDRGDMSFKLTRALLGKMGGKIK